MNIRQLTLPLMMEKTGLTEEDLHRYGIQSFYEHNRDVPLREWKHSALLRCLKQHLLLPFIVAEAIQREQIVSWLDQKLENKTRRVKVSG
jgi:hypothetical protein